MAVPLKKGFGSWFQKVAERGVRSRPATARAAR